MRKNIFISLLPKLRTAVFTDRTIVIIQHKHAIILQIINMLCKEGFITNVEKKGNFLYIRLKQTMFDKRHGYLRSIKDIFR